MSSKVFSDTQSFKARKIYEKSAKLHETVESQFGNLNIKDAIKCPDGIAANEWLAVHTVDFYNQTNVIFGNLASHHCTNATCPLMNAGPKYQYLWADGEKVKKPIKCSAPEYVEYLMNWVSSRFEDDELFPQGPDFLPTVKIIFKRLFRVYSHVYYNHFTTMEQIEADSYLNVSFKHFIFFSYHYHLIDDKELKPLKSLIDKFQAKEAEYEMSRKFSGGLPIDTMFQAAPVQPNMSPESGTVAPSDPVPSLENSTHNSNSSLPSVIHEVEPIPEPAPNVMEVETMSFPSPPPPLVQPPKLVTRTIVRIEEEFEGQIYSPTVELQNKCNAEDLLAPTSSGWTHGDPVAEFDSEDEGLEDVEKDEKDGGDEESKHFFPDTVAIVKSNSPEFWTYTSSSTNQIIPPHSHHQTFDSYAPKVLLVGVSWDCKIVLKLLESSGYSVSGIFVESISHDDAESEFAHLFLSGDIDLHISKTDLVMISGDDYAKRKDDFFLDLVKKCNVFNKSVCILPGAMPLPKRRDVLSLIDSEKDDVFTLSPLRFLPAMTKLKQSLKVVGDPYQVQINLQCNWKSDMKTLFEAEGKEVVFQKMVNLMSTVSAHMVDLFSWILDQAQVSEVHSSFACLSDKPERDEELFETDFATMHLRSVSGASGIVTISFVNGI